MPRRCRSLGGRNRDGLGIRLVTTASPGLEDYDRAELAKHALGSHLRRGVERAVLGSVAWEVVRFSPTPVRVVPYR